MSMTKYLQKTEHLLQNINSSKIEDSFIKAIILFGSRARRDHSKHSDFDLLIVGDFPSSWDILQRKMHITELLFKKSPFIGDILITTHQEFLDALNANRAIALNIAIDGKVVYDPEDLFDIIHGKLQEKNQHGLQRGNHYWYWKKL